MIKELHDLKCRAIAVDVPDWAEEWEIAYFAGMPCIVFKTKDDTKKDIIAIPEDDENILDWEIVGRANEIYLEHEKQIFVMFKGYDIFSDLELWQQYCATNGLTNELILIEKE